ncbi:uncharacterized protein LOC125248480 isoform X2 [Megalobrama amblycephala]|uniref:uncharacterized protein LOC125248480 isoform X2 n=1 Tax=Megalobrama amblycephala TaxID=75352 RepID=UPI002013EF69|nr:uncharacterized protein LOC125248480 isoform X2 [Megalobrama amblycephala]
MGQCTSHSCVAVQDSSACMSPTPVPERVEKKKRGRLFRWCFSRKSKKTTIEAQQGRCRNCRNQKPQRCSDGEHEQKNNTQSINTPSKNKIVHSLDKAEESSDTNTSVFSHVSPFSGVRVVKVDVHRAEDSSATTLHSHVSPFSAVEKVNEDEAEENSNTSVFSHVSPFSGVRVVKVDVHRAEDSSATTLHSHVSPFSAVEKVNEDEAEENSNTSVYSCVSSFSAVEKVNEDVAKAEENSNTSVYSWHSCVSTLNTVQEADAPRQEQEEINTNNSTSPTVSSIAKGDLNAPLPLGDMSWKTEDEIINLSPNPKTGNISQDYEIGRLLGQGGFGKVFEGTRLSDSRKVALKHVAKEECYGNERLSLFGKALPNEVAMMIRVSEGPSVPQIIKLLDWYKNVWSP